MLFFKWLSNENYKKTNVKSDGPCTVSDPDESTPH